jgi:NADH:ubiquinone oxidoreductase subunit C
VAEETVPEPIAEDAPTLPPVAAALVERFPDSVAVDSHGQSVVYVDRAAWHDVAVFLRGEERFTQCVDVTAVDHLAATERVQIPGVDSERFESSPTSSRTRATSACA